MMDAATTADCTPCDGEEPKTPCNIHNILMMRAALRAMAGTLVRCRILTSARAQQYITALIPYATSSGSPCYYYASVFWRSSRISVARQLARRLGADAHIDGTVALDHFVHALSRPRRAPADWYQLARLWCCAQHA